MWNIKILRIYKGFPQKACCIVVFCTTVVTLKLQQQQQNGMVNNEVLTECNFSEMWWTRVEQHGDKVSALMSSLQALTAMSASHAAFLSITLHD